MPEPRQSPLPREELLHEFLATTELRDTLRQLADAIVHVAGVGSVARVARAERRRQPVLQLIEARARPPPGGAEQHGTGQGGTENGKEHGFVVHAHMVNCGSAHRTDRPPRSFSGNLVISRTGP